MYRRISLFSVRRRYFSSVPNDPKAGGSTAEASQDSFWKKNQKYAIVGIPLLLSTVVAIDIINNVNHRDTLELYCPSFVEFVREHYGFTDEDPVERARVKFVTEQLKKPVNVNVRMRSGNVVSILEVDGSQTAERLIEELQNRTEDKLNNKMLLAATFAAVDDDQQSTVEHTIARATATVSPLAEKPMPEYRLQSEGAAVLFDSLWAGAPGPSSRTATVDLQAGLSRGVLYSRFGNVYSDIMTGLHRYSELSAQRIPMGPLHDNSPERRSKVQAQRKASSSTAQPDFVKIQAQERIKSLEMEIGSLELERRMGSREIDTIDNEIRARRQEITNISRKYLNYFYFF